MNNKSKLQHKPRLRLLAFDFDEDQENERQERSNGAPPIQHRDLSTNIHTNIHEYQIQRYYSTHHAEQNNAYKFGISGISSTTACYFCNFKSTKAMLANKYIFENFRTGFITQTSPTVFIQSLSCSYLRSNLGNEICL